MHTVRQRDFDMLFALSNYQTSVGHVSLYVDTGSNLI